MPTTVSLTASGVSPAFVHTGEPFQPNFFQGLGRLDIDGVEPPVFGEHGGASVAHTLTNRWFPWVDEKIVEPKWDGVGADLGQITNRPSPFKDFYLITLFRAADYVLRPRYVAFFQASVNQPAPVPPPDLGP